MTQPAILTEHLTKRFGKHRGITDVTLKIEPGQVFGFLGPNGAGKTTTIRCLLGLYRPTSGRALVLGHDPSDADAGFLAGVGYLPGELNRPGSLTGREVLERFGSIRQLTSTAYRDELIERFGAEVDRPVKSLSKGNKQKIGLVLAFMHQPRLLVLDEPTSGLDPLLQEEFDVLLTECAEQGQTVLLSSHNLEEVQRVAQRIAIIKSGRIVVDDSVDHLRGAAPHTIELTFGHDVDAHALRAVSQVTLATARRISLTHTGPAAPVLSVIAGLEPDTITARPANIDELFLRLYAGDNEDTHAY